MAQVRRPPSDEELRKQEREMLAERLQMDLLDRNAEEQAKLAEAGEPEAMAARQDAVEALQRASRGNSSRLTPHLTEAMGMADAAIDLPHDTVEDPRSATIREQQQRERIGRERYEKNQIKQQMNLEDRGRSVLDLHWRRWAKEGTRNYSKACRQLQLDIGRDAVLLWTAGIFDSQLAIAKFIQSFQLTEKEQEGSDWQDKIDKELAELRGED